jgi:hypothetical protein
VPENIRAATAVEASIAERRANFLAAVDFT